MCPNSVKIDRKLRKTLDLSLIRIWFYESEPKSRKKDPIHPYFLNTTQIIFPASRHLKDCYISKEDHKIRDTYVLTKFWYIFNCNDECQNHFDFFNARMQTEKHCVTSLQVFDKICISAICSSIVVLILHEILEKKFCIHCTCVNSVKHLYQYAFQFAV